MKTFLIILASVIWGISVNAQVVYFEPCEGTTFPINLTNTPIPNNWARGMLNCNGNTVSPVINTSNPTNLGDYNWALSRATDKAFRGSYSSRFELRQDMPLVGTSLRHRGEVSLCKPADGDLRSDTAGMWYGFAVLFPSFGTEYDPVREAWNQWFEDGSDETTLRMEQSHAFIEVTPPAGVTQLMKYDLFSTASTQSTSGLGGFALIPRDKWFQFVFHFKHDSTVNGLIEVWRDGVKIHTISGRNTHLVNTPKWTIGIYKPKMTDSQRYQRILYFDNIRLGRHLTTLSNMIDAPVTNLSPISIAGSSQIITLPTNSVTVNGSASSDPDGSIVSYTWSKVSGGVATITSPNNASTTITGLVQGTYTFRLTVTDNYGALATSQMNVTVNAAAVAPTANAGADQTITLPTSSVSLTGGGTGAITSYAWGKVTGFGGTITSQNAQNTTVTGLTYGSYSYRLTVTDATGLTGSDIMLVTVDSVVTPYPVANAGADQSITLPTNTATLSGSATTTTGTITNYAWAKVSGPSGGTITSPTSASTGITGLIQGTYAYQLTATNSWGKTNTDLMQIIVNPAIPPANLPPVADAGIDQSITLPTSFVTINGSSSTDPGGTIVAYSWAKLSGPSGGFITNATNVITTVTGMTTAGVYTYSLIVTDNLGSTGSDVMQITVLPAININPTVYAGPDKSFRLPTNAVTITQSTAADSDGTIQSITWTKSTGPTQYTISNGSTLFPTFSNLIVGTYTFIVIVTDNKNATATDSMTVTVSQKNGNPRTYFRWPKVINAQ